ncbi:MAG TPA: methyltransferase type 11, partial [Desulfopila sp.]|nr:methyltransferase type 11 [Desulfopila sp.]
EYLLHPRRIMRQCARVLKQDGVMVLSFSNRWFPGKVTMLWQKLHEYERIGFVVACLQGAFNSVRTISYRNWPRSTDDPHYSKLQTSDPLYIVTAKKSPLS